MEADGGQELYHEIFGSILDRREMTPYLLRRCGGYAEALLRATQMLANRGFDAADGKLSERERSRAMDYARQADAFLSSWLFPFVEGQLRGLAELASPLRPDYERGLASIGLLRSVLKDGEFSALVKEDPRHLFLLASSAKYPDLFRGYRGRDLRVPPLWSAAACSTLKVCHLVKSLEEDSQDIHDYTRLGLFFEERGRDLGGLFDLDWNDPEPVPEDEPARRAFAKLSAFFRKLDASVSRGAGGGQVFDSGDGVRVDIAEIKARLKSPESMFAKLGKNAEEETYGIRDVLAVTFLIRSREDSLTLFHALQKRGVILQEYAVSTSITQTLFRDSADMEGAVRVLMRNLARSEGSEAEPSEEAVRGNAAGFFKALGVNAGRNPHSADIHRKFQCKINFPVAVHREAASGRVLVPGTDEYARRETLRTVTRQHTLPVELRISDRASWEESERRGEAHHDAYRCRQLLALMNRLFDPVFRFPPEAYPLLRADQERLFT